MSRNRLRGAGLRKPRPRQRPPRARGPHRPPSGGRGPQALAGRAPPGRPHRTPPHSCTPPTFRGSVSWGLRTPAAHVGGAPSRSVAGAGASPQGALNSPRETGPEQEAKRQDRSPRHPPLGPSVSLLDRGRNAPIWGSAVEAPPADTARWHRWARARAHGSVSREAGRGPGTGALAQAGPPASRGLRFFST